MLWGCVLSGGWALAGKDSAEAFAVERPSVAPARKISS
jgi:hypothetical protein